MDAEGAMDAPGMDADAKPTDPNGTDAR